MASIPKWLEKVTPGASKAKELKQRSPKADKKRREKSRKKDKKKNK